MPSLQLFSEILVVGALLALGMQPLLRRLFPSFDLRALPASGPVLLMGIALIYALGIAGNRLSEAALAGWFEPGARYRAELAEWGREDPARRPTSWMNAELRVQERSARMAAWIERHRSYERILRGASLASALLLASMAAAHVLARRGERSYGAWHFVGGCALLALFLYAFASQDRLIRFRVSSYLMESVRIDGAPRP
ncbi:MAG TPA: hypothetical protein VFT98_12850 [Myxococcota bacterium]|nr:hypothetical protein [Myxococcota bacterium]